MLDIRTYKQPKSLKSRKTFQKILDASAKCFHTLTYHKATVAEIAKIAGIGTGTVYLYFDSKQDIFRYLVLSYHHEIRKEIALAIKDCKTRLEIEREGFKAYYRYIFNNPYAYTIIWQSLMVDQELFTYYYSSFAKHYQKGLEVAKDNDEIYQDINIDDAAYTLMGISNFIGLKLTIFEKPTNQEEAINKAIEETIKLLRNGYFK